MSEKVAENIVASVHYTGTLPESGEVFDSSEGRDPLTFLVGHRQMIPGFEANLMGATVGERREFTLAAEEAYGERDDEAVLQIPRDNFAQLEQEDGAALEIGMQLVAQMPHGPWPLPPFPPSSAPNPPRPPASARGNPPRCGAPGSTGRPRPRPPSTGR